MSDQVNFWTIVKADALFALCSMGLTILGGIVIALWRGRRKVHKKVWTPPQGPRITVFGGQDPHPGHCPLCGRDWPLPGPGGPSQIV